MTTIRRTHFCVLTPVVVIVNIGHVKNPMMHHSFNLPSGKIQMST
jgi:hypothetical protein